MFVTAQLKSYWWKKIEIDTISCLVESYRLKGAVRLMRTRIRFLAQPESMRSIVGATQ